MGFLTHFCILALCVTVGHGGWGESIGQALRGAAEQTGQVFTNARDTVVDEYHNLRVKVGQIDVFGSLKYNGIKPGKRPRQPNEHVLVWNGTVKVVPGILPTDPAELAAVPLNVAEQSKFGKPCKKPNVRYVTLNSSDQVQKGPKADKLKRNSFRPCNDRKSGAGDAGARIGSFGGRFKRSESYLFPSFLWKSNKISYAIDSSVPEPLNETVTAALQLWVENTCLIFQKVETPTSRRTRSVMTGPGQALAEAEPYILFKWAGGPCSTDRNGPNPNAPHATTIDISNCKNLTGAIAHEIGNALGLSHSQTRVDRDQYVKVFPQNVAESWASQFEQNSEQYFDHWDVPYYYDSIMHYSAYDASKNGLMTICPLNPLAEVVMGQREEPSFGDISLINHMYCKESCFSEKQLKGMEYFGNKSRTISERKCQNWSAQTPHRHNFTSVGNHSSCRNPDGWEGGPWCFTTDASVPYEPCFSSCEDMKRVNLPACNGWCYNGGYHDPSNCTCVCPPHTSGPFCENVHPVPSRSLVPCGGKTELHLGALKRLIDWPDGEGNYTENTLCMWWLVAPKDARVKLTIYDFSLEIPDQQGCYDYLEIRPSLCAGATIQPDKMRYCGNSLASLANGTSKYMLSDDNNMILKFYADENENAKGFYLIAEAVAAAGS